MPAIRNLTIVDPNDPTKRIRIDASNLPTGTTRTVTGPTADGPMGGSGGSFGPHTHPQSEVVGLVDDLLRKAANDDPRLSDARTPLAHGHAQADVTGLVSALAGKAATSHGHAIADTTSLQSALDDKAATAHAHAQSDVTGLVSALAGKAATSHAHAASDITSGVFPVARLATGTPDGTKFVRDDGVLAVPPLGGGGGVEPWEGLLHIAWGDGNPSMDEALFGFQNTVLSVAGPTATGIGTAVGRLVSFRFKTAITVATLRWFGLAATTNLYTLAIYNAATGARVHLLDPMNTVAGWSSAAVTPPLVLAANTRYWLGIGAKATGTTAALRSPASPIANSLGLAAPPGKIGDFGLRFAQVALTAGAWPVTLPTLAAAAFASAGTTGTLPLIFLEA